MDICSRNEKLAIRRPAILVALALYCVVVKHASRVHGDTTSGLKATSHDATIVTTDAWHLAGHGVSPRLATGFLG